MVRETFFGKDPVAFNDYFEKVAREGRIEMSWLKLDEDSDHSVQVLSVPLGRMVKADEPLLRFDLMTGDQLFVDRISYNFIRPEVGSGFVFRTGNIPGIADEFGDEYYIKRLVGVPGDVLEIRQPVLYRNGSPITGAEAFDLNARQVYPYTGYTFGDTLSQGRYLFQGQTLTVPPDKFFALGDNSSNSSDGRVWGFVPAKDVAGRPLFIYYPFTRRWGPAR
jgi:signal peptidase I